jgi:DNA-directed RNA polymerase subunit RPC12/RpoP
MKLQYLTAFFNSLTDQTVQCPHCRGTVEITTEDHDELFTYHGDEAPQPVTCPYCDGEFMVKEIVRRTFEVMEDDHPPEDGDEDDGESDDNPEADDFEQVEPEDPQPHKEWVR